MRMGRAGFTLTEILVAVALVGILAAVAVVNYGLTIQRTRFDTARDVITKIYDGEQKYFSTIAEGFSFFPTPANTQGACSGAVPCINLWRGNLFMDDPNPNPPAPVGGPIGYAVTTAGAPPTTFTVTATYNGLTQTVDQNRVFCPPCPTCPVGAGCTWGRP